MPPIAKKIPHIHSIHNHQREDNYYWLKDRENPEVISYLEAENAYTKEVMAHTESLQHELFEEMKGRIKKDDSSVPYKLDNYYYYRRFEKGKEYPIYCRKKNSLDGEEEVYLDVNVLAEGQSYCQVIGLTVSRNHQYLAYSVDFSGRRIYQLRILNLNTGELLPERVEFATGNATWANDNQTLFYSLQDKQTLRSHRIYKHKLGTDSQEDQLIYEETDDTFRAYVGKSKSRDYILITSSSTLSNEVRFTSAHQPDQPFEVFLPREKKHEYSVDQFGEYFYVNTNWQAKNFRLMKTPVNATGKENWKEVIPHRKDVLLEDIDIFEEFLVLEEKYQGLNRLRVISWDGKADYYIDFQDSAYTAYIDFNPEFNTHLLRYGYQSMTTPSSIFEIDLHTKEKKLLKQQEVLGGFSPDHYQSERIFAVARDGVKVPISMVYRKGTPKDGSAPLLLYAYGSYGINIDPYFSPSRLSLLDRGFIFAIAHIRGGSDMGRKWYDDGKMLKKKNTFTDFIDCSEHLISENYTQKERLFCSGGSAGGLLIGAVINMRPDLFKGAMAAVPFVDVVTTMLDEDIPLTTGEYDEWGNPNQEEYYRYMLSYSPYDNIEAKDYPHLLVTTGLHDAAVQYWEPAKWVAKLRELKTDHNRLLLHTNMEAGHSGASGRFQPYKEVALEYGFLLDLAGK
jgi:oligopeptidase B